MKPKKEFVFQSDSLPQSSFNFFREMKDKGEYCDIILKVGDLCIPAHSVIIAATIPYLREMIRTRGEQVQISIPEVDDIEPSAIQSMIEFAYQCRLKINTDCVIDLLCAASRFHMDEVRNACCNFLADNLYPENVMQIRDLSKRLDCSDLVENTNKCIKENFVEISQREDFLKCSFPHLKEIIASDDLHCNSEEKVFEAVMKWITHARSEREKYLQVLLENVRLAVLSPVYFRRHVARDSLIQSSPQCLDMVDEITDYHMFPEHRKPDFAYNIHPRRYGNSNRADNGKNSASKREQPQSCKNIENADGEKNECGERQDSKDSAGTDGQEEEPSKIYTSSAAKSQTVLRNLLQNKNRESDQYDASSEEHKHSRIYHGEKQFHKSTDSAANEVEEQIEMYDYNSARSPTMLQNLQPYKITEKSGYNAAGCYDARERDDEEIYNPTVAWSPDYGTARNFDSTEEYDQREISQRAKELHYSVSSSSDASVEDELHGFQYETQQQFCTNTSVAGEDNNPNGIFAFHAELSFTLQRFDCSTEKWLINNKKTVTVNTASVAGLNNEIFFMDCEDMCYYNPEENDLEFTERYTQGRAYAAVGNDLYVFGGSDGQVVFSSAKCFDSEEEKWYDLKCMREHREYASCVVMGGHLYVLGGNSLSRVHSSVERYDPESGIWNNVEPMLTRRSDFGSATLNERIYACGGIESLIKQECICTAEVYDPKEDKWMFIESLSHARRHFTLVSYYGKLYCLGGNDDNEDYVNAVEIYNPRSETWTLGHSMDPELQITGAAVIQNLEF